MERNTTIDLIKGIAAVIMIYANTVPYFFNFESEFFIRLLFSVAAPIFIISSGYITQINITNQGLKKSKFIYRVIQILFFGVVIDAFFWHSIPFVTFDVLYLIGLSQLLLLLINKKHFFIVALAIFIISFISHHFFYYRFTINELSSFSINSLINANPIKRMFFDGWFPLFPWLGFFLLGSFTQEYIKEKIKIKISFLILGILLISLFFIFGEIPKIRNSYLELWYPLNGISLLIPFGVFFIFNGIIQYSIKVDGIFSKIIVIIGKNTLFVYTFHAFIISIITDNNLLQNFSLNQRKFSFWIFIIFVLFIILLFQKIKDTHVWIKTPKMIKFLLCN